MLLEVGHRRLSLIPGHIRWLHLFWMPVVAFFSASVLMPFRVYYAVFRDVLVLVL